MESDTDLSTAFMTRLRLLTSVAATASAGSAAASASPIQKLPIGVVGGGFGAAFFWHEHPDCEVTAVTDLRADRQKRLADRYYCTNVYSEDHLLGGRSQHRRSCGERPGLCLRRPGGGDGGPLSGGSRDAVAPGIARGHQRDGHCRATAARSQRGGPSAASDRGCERRGRSHGSGAPAARHLAPGGFGKPALSLRGGE